MKYLVLMVVFLAFGCSGKNLYTHDVAPAQSEATHFQITLIDINAETYLITDVVNKTSWTVGKDGVPHYLELKK